MKHAHAHTKIVHTEANMNRTTKIEVPAVALAGAKYETALP